MNVNRKQIKILVNLIADNRRTITYETHRKWGMALIDALSETDADAAFESLRRRFSRKYGLRLGGCTPPLVAA